MLFGVQISIQVLGQEIPFEKENSARCHGDKVEPALEAEPTVEVVPQDLPLQNSSLAPGELLSHGVKEESDMEPELGEGSYLLCCVVVSGRSLGVAASMAKCVSKQYSALENVERPDCILNHS